MSVDTLGEMGTGKMAVERKYDLYSPEFRKHSHEVFAAMRHSDPVFQQPGISDDFMIWFVTSYAEVEQVLLNDKIFVRDPLLAFSQEEVEKFMGMGDPRLQEMLNNHMLNKEGESHRRLRSLVSKAFTPRVIQSMRPRIQQIADDLLDRVVERGRMELVSDYAFPLPITVIAELLSIPVEDRAKFRAWSNTFVRPALTTEEQQESFRMLQEMVAYLVNLIAARRANPGNDLLSDLIHAEEQGDHLSQGELFSMVNLLIVAGHETTVTFIGNAVLALLQHPADLERLKQHPESMPEAVEELLRYDSPVERALNRWVAQDVELGGKHLRRGDAIITIQASADRDETRFENPDRLDLDRSPNPHMAFGKGVHYCLGAPLARLEGEIALNTLFRRLPDIELDLPVEQLEYRDVPLFHSLVTLPVRWRVR